MIAQRFILTQEWQYVGDTPLEVEVASQYPAIVTISEDMPQSNDDLPVASVGGVGNASRVFDAPGQKVYAKSSHIGESAINVFPRADISGSIVSLQDRLLMVDPDTLDVFTGRKD